MNKTTVLNPKKVTQIIKRIAYQLFEDFLTEDEIVMVGIERNGFLFAQLLANELNKLSINNNTVLLCSAKIDKSNPSTEGVEISVPNSSYEGKNVIIVDDVLNSGRTLLHTVGKLMQTELKLMRTVTLVDRRHRKFPIKADYVGLTLSTTLQEHIEVEFDGGNVSAYLV